MSSVFPIAPGYNNLPGGNAFPVLYSKNVLLAFRKTSISERITNTDYQGDIVQYGQTVNIRKEPGVSVTPYRRGEQVVADTLDDAMEQLNIDQGNKFAIALDDVAEKQSDLNYMSLGVNRGAYELKNKYDQNILLYMSGTADADNTIGSSGSPVVIKVNPGSGQYSPLDILNEGRTLLDLQNVPEEDRWLAADPQYWKQIAQEDSKFVPTYITGLKESPIMKGNPDAQPIHGFTPYKSNNLPSGGTGAGGSGSGNYGVIMMGSKLATTTAQQLIKSEMFRNPNDFGDVFRALHVFGRKTLRPNALVVVFYNTAGT